MSFKKLGLLVCKLLKGITITLFVNEPTNIDKNIETRLIFMKTKIGVLY